MGRFTEKNLQRVPNDVQEEQLRQDNERFPEELHELLDVAQKNLARWYGVTDLTTSEGVALRKILEACLTQRNEEIKMVRAGEVTGVGIAQPIIEAIHRWFIELYSIDLSNLADVASSPAERRAYIRRVRERSHEPGLM